MSPEQILKRQILLRRQAIDLVRAETTLLVRKHRLAICELRLQLLASRFRSGVKRALMSAHGRGLIKDSFVKWFFHKLNLREA